MGKGLPRSRKDRGLIKKVIKLTNKSVAVADEAATTGYASVLVHTFPEGFVKFEGAHVQMGIELDAAGVNADWDGDISVGTVASDNTAAPLASTEADFVPNTAIPQAVASVTTATAVSTATETGVFHDGSTTPVPVYLNFKIDDADQDVTTTPTNLLLTGSVTIWYQEMGDV